MLVGCVYVCAHVCDPILPVGSCTLLGIVVFVSSIPPIQECCLLVMPNWPCDRSKSDPLASSRLPRLLLPVLRPHHQRSLVNLLSCSNSFLQRRYVVQLVRKLAGSVSRPSHSLVYGDVSHLVAVCVVSYWFLPFLIVIMCFRGCLTLELCLLSLAQVNARYMSTNRPHGVVCCLSLFLSSLCPSSRYLPLCGLCF